MALPIVRSPDEAHLFMDLHPCDRCHDVDVDWQSDLTDDEGVPARRYHGVCGGCGAEREFVFRLPERPAVPDADRLVFFGGPGPSHLFDPGEWRLISEVAIKDGSAPYRDDPDQLPERKQSFALGVAAIAEILKFIPDGADAVPETAFRTPHGRASYDQNPRHFTREYLEGWLETFQFEMEARFSEE